MTIIDKYISGCIRCGFNWTTYAGMSADTFGMSEEQAQDHIRSFWENHSPYSLNTSDSPYLCPDCGSLEVEFRNCNYDSGDGEDNPLLDGRINTNPPDQVADAFITLWLEELEQVSSAVIPEIKKTEIIAELEGRIAQISKSSMRDSEAFAKYYGPAMRYYETQYRHDLGSLMLGYRDNSLAFATFTDPDNFFDDHESYLQIKEKKRFLQCLFFEVLLDQAFDTAGFMPKERDGCLYGSVKVVHILAAAGAMVDPYFLLLAASRWADDTDDANEDFEQLCWLFERELRRTLKGLEWEHFRNGPESPYFYDQEWPRPFRHDLVQDDMARLMRYHNDVGDLLQTGYFSGRQDFANREVFDLWVATLNSSTLNRGKP